jgi:Helix-turn-helix domain (DUF4817)
MPFRYTNTEYRDMIFLYGWFHGNASAAAEEYTRRYPDRRRPNCRTITNVYAYLGEKGTVPSFSGAERESGRNDEQILRMVENSPSTSTRRISRRIRGVTFSHIAKRLKIHGMHPYHYQKVQHLLPADRALRLEFCLWLRRRRHSWNKILFTDEATFTRSGITNTKNTHFWAGENPHSISEANFQHRFSLNVWGGVVGNYLIGPYFFEGRLTAEVYHNFLENELPLLMEELPLRLRAHMWFQHDGAPVHTARRVVHLLDTSFPQKWIGKGGNMNWPPRSPDLTPLDFFIWGDIKSKVYSSGKPASIEILRERVINGFNELRGEIPAKRWDQSLRKRVAACIEQGGGHFEHLLK